MAVAPNLETQRRFLTAHGFSERPEDPSAAWCGYLADQSYPEGEDADEWRELARRALLRLAAWTVCHPAAESAPAADPALLDALEGVERELRTEVRRARRRSEKRDALAAALAALAARDGADGHVAARVACDLADLDRWMEALAALDAADAREPGQVEVANARAGIVGAWLQTWRYHGYDDDPTPGAERDALVAAAIEAATRVSAALPGPLGPILASIACRGAWDDRDAAFLRDALRADAVLDAFDVEALRLWDDLPTRVELTLGDLEWALPEPEICEVDRGLLSILLADAGSGPGAIEGLERWLAWRRPSPDAARTTRALFQWAQGLPPAARDGAEGFLTTALCSAAGLPADPGRGHLPEALHEALGRAVDPQIAAWWAPWRAAREERRASAQSFVAAESERQRLREAEEEARLEEAIRRKNASDLSTAVVFVVAAIALGLALLRSLGAI